MLTYRTLTVFFAFYILDLYYHIQPIYGSGQTFDEAKQKCDGYGRRLPIISTRDEYTAVLKSGSNGDVSWLDTYWNETLQVFQWANGKIVSVNRWAEYQPVEGLDCVYFIKGSWYTTDCSESYRYICSEGRNDLNASNYGDELVTFHTAIERCDRQDKMLPVILTEEEYKLSQNVEYKVWLGMYRSYDLYRWITGDEVSLLGSRGCEGNGVAHLHVHFDNNRLEIHGDSNKQKQICQDSSITEDTFTLSNHYVFKMTQVRLSGPYLMKFTTYRRTQCAIECSKRDFCFKYTRIGPICTLYGEVSYQIDGSSNEVLWEREKIPQRF